MSDNMLTSLDPHMHIKSREKQSVNDWDSDHNRMLKIKTKVQCVWHFNCVIFLPNRFCFQVLPSFEAAYQFSWDTYWIQDDKRIVSKKSNHQCEKVVEIEQVQLFQGIESESCHLGERPAKSSHVYSIMILLNKRENHMKNKKSAHDLRKNCHHAISCHPQSWENDI